MAAPKKTIKAVQKMPKKKEPLYLNITANMAVEEFATEAAEIYGNCVVLDRAIPDIRDGLKPVQRRILYAMVTLGLKSSGSYITSARVAGDTAGKFHPHSSPYPSMVTLANYPTPLIDGQGNWDKERPAADRYTSARFSKFAEKYMVTRDYLPIVPMVDNYDMHEKEPLYLPALLPHCLMQDMRGIAYSISTVIPAFHPKGLTKAVVSILQGKEIDAAFCRKTLVFNYTDGGGECIADNASLDQLFNTGQASIRFAPGYSYDEAKKTLTINSLNPMFNLEKALGIPTKPGFGFVQSVKNFKSKKAKDAAKEKTPNIAIAFKGNDPTNIEKVISYLETSIPYQIYFARPKTLDLESIKGEPPAKRYGVIEALHEWTKHRVALEKRYQQYVMDGITKEITRLELMILAAANLEIIFKSLKVDDSKGYLVKHMKITEEQAHDILEMKVRSLSKLNQADTKAKIKELKAEHATADSRKKKTKAYLAEVLTTVMGAL